MIHEPTQTWRYGDSEIPLTEAALHPVDTFNKVLSSIGIAAARDFYASINPTWFAPAESTRIRNLLCEALVIQIMDAVLNMRDQILEESMQSVTKLPNLKMRLEIDTETFHRELRWHRGYWVNDILGYLYDIPIKLLTTKEPTLRIFVMSPK